MIVQYLVRRIETQVIEYLCRVSVIDPDFEGPVDPDHPAPTVTPPCEPGCELIEWAGDFGQFNEATSPTSALEWHGGPHPIWVERGDMPAQRAHKAAAISQACADAITAGFPCDALGDQYFYPAKPNDQANLTGSVVRSMYPNIGPDWRTPFWCADGAGAWEFRLHTAAQIQHVGECAVVARLNCMGINEQLQAQIIAAENPADLADINWPSETP
jgi:hypothetical protein